MTIASSRNEAIRRCLTEGACTSGEIAAILSITPRSARVGLWVLQHMKHVHAIGTLPRERGPERKIYALTARGQTTR